MKNQTTLHTSFKVSLVTPTFKRKKFLEKNYEILKEIKSKKFEWVIVTEDDDYETNKLVEKFDKSFVKQISGKFGDNDLAFNHGVNEADGSLICIYGDDDFLNKDTIDLLEKNFEDKVDWYIGHANYIDQQNKQIRKITSLIKNILLNHFSKNILYLVNFIMTPSVFFSKKKFLELNKLNHEMRHATDYVLWLQFSQISKPKIIRKTLSLVTFTNKTKTGSFDYKRYFEIYKNINKFSNNPLLRSLQFSIILLIIVYNFFTKKIFKLYN